jgi:hypothetical protein
VVSENQPRVDSLRTLALQLRDGTLDATQGPINVLTLDEEVEEAKTCPTCLKPLVGLDFSFDVFLEAVGMHNLVQLFTCVLLEKRILLVSRNYTLLTMTAECLRRMIRPFVWSHVYVPVLPRSMLDMLQCPTPFIIGIHSGYAWKHDFPFVTDLVVMDLDMDELSEGDNAEIKQILPTGVRSRLVKRLRAALTRRVSRVDLAVSSQDIQSSKHKEMEIMLAFSEAVKELLFGAANYCYDLNVRGERAVVFDYEAWIDERSDSGDVQLLSLIGETQAFSRWIVDG